MIDKLRKFIHPTWINILKPVLESKEFINTIELYKAEVKAKRPAYPVIGKLFHCLEYNLERIRMVIIGEEPFRSHQHAHGLAFSSNSMTPVDVIETIQEEIFQTEFKPHDKHVQRDDMFCCQNLEQWADQGILLLNQRLSVGKEYGSHKHFGWEILTSAVMEHLNNRQEPIVFQLWGRKFESFAEQIGKQHCVITAPSPELEPDDFVGSRCFEKAQKFWKDQKNHETPGFRLALVPLACNFYNIRFCHPDDPHDWGNYMLPSYYADMIRYAFNGLPIEKFHKQPTAAFKAKLFQALLRLDKPRKPGREKIYTPTKQNMAWHLEQMLKILDEEGDIFVSIEMKSY